MCSGIVVCLCATRAHVARNPLALVEDLDRAIREARINGLAQQGERHRVVMGINLDVIVRRDRAALPLGILVAPARKPFQRRPVETDEEIVAALLERLHHLRVDRRYAVANGLIQLDQGEEAPIAQLAEHEARDDADGSLHLGLVARASNARRQHDKAVVIGEILIRPVDAWLVARRLGDASFEIVGHRSLRHTAEEVERVDVRSNPVGQRLAPARLGVGIARRAEGRDEQVRVVHLARHRIDDRHRVTGPVDKQLVARHMRLPHRRCEAPSPFAVKLAEAGISVALDMLSAMLLPQDHQRHAAALEFLVNLRPFRHRLRRAVVESRRHEQPPLQLGVSDLRRDRPRDPDHLRAAHVLGDRRLADTCGLAHLTDAEPQLMRQPQHLTDLPHRHSHPGHRLPLSFLTGLPIC
jgi:hypothetical protein